jgi:hypothetical protein
MLLVTVIDMPAGFADVMLPITCPSDVWTIVMIGSCVYRRKYFPLTPPRMSYSARISSSLSGSGFILPPLLRRDSARADDADFVSTIRMPHDQQIACLGEPRGEPSLLVLQVIDNTRRQEVAEHAAGLLKRVVSRFVWKSVKRVFRLVYRTLLVSPHAADVTRARMTVAIFS